MVLRLCRHSSFVVGVRTGFQRFSLFAEDRVVQDSGALERELKSGLEHFESVAHAAAEVDGRSFLKIFGRTGNFADPEAEVNALGEHLIVENEIVAVLPQWQAGKYIAAEGAMMDRLAATASGTPME